MGNQIIKDIYEELLLESPDWIPEEYEEEIRRYTDSFAGKNQLPIKDSYNQYMYPINRTLVMNRVTNQLMKALMNGEKIKTDRGVELLVTKNPNYPIMLNGKEERALCRAIQESNKISDEEEREIVKSFLAEIVIAFLSPRIKFVYKRFEKAIGSYGAYEDVIQEMMLATFKLLNDFNFERTTAGITRDFMNMRMCRAINIALSSSRSSSMAQETWKKVSKFTSHPEDHQLSREEIKKKYHCSSGLVDVMYSFVENGSLEVSLDYSAEDKNGTNDSRRSTLSDFLPAKDYSKEEIELDMILRRILSPLQYKVIKLKVQGYSHNAIAKILHFDKDRKLEKAKRRSQYQFLLARDIIEREFKVDTSLYSKGREKRQQNRILKEQLLAAENSMIHNIMEDDEELPDLDSLKKEFANEKEKFKDNHFESKTSMNGNKERGLEEEPIEDSEYDEIDEEDEMFEEEDIDNYSDDYLEENMG